MIMSDNVKVLMVLKKKRAQFDKFEIEVYLHSDLSKLL